MYSINNAYTLSHFDLFCFVNICSWPVWFSYLYPSGLLQWLRYLKPFHVEDKEPCHGLVQQKRNSSALAMELHLSCTNPSHLSYIVNTMPVVDPVIQWAMASAQFSNNILILAPKELTESLEKVCSCGGGRLLLINSTHNLGRTSRLLMQAA